MNPIIYSQVEVLRRIAENGLEFFLERRDSFGVDNFQHLLDEIALLKTYLEEIE